MRIGAVVAAVVLVIALSASGCASGSDAPASPAAAATEAPALGNSTQPDTPDDASATPEGAEASTLDEEPVRADDEESRNDVFVSPIFDAVGIDPNDRQDAQDVFVANAEELVRQCMADAGFEYMPSIPAVGPSISRLWELNESVSSEQFTAEYGYGIATLLELDFFEDGVLAFVELVLGPPSSEARSQGEQAAYELALSGETVQGLTAEEVQEQTTDTIGGAEEGSCRNYGYSNADNSLGEKFDGLFTLLGDDFEALEDQVDNDPRIREITTEWQTCMAALGYSYETSEEISNEIDTAGRSLRNRFQSSTEALAIFQAAGDANLAAMNADDRHNFLEQAGAFQGFALVPSLQAELDELIEREITVAGHDLGCADVDTFVAVRLEYEQGFVEQHAAQLALIASGAA